MLEVDIDKILPLTEARDSFNKIVDEVEGSDQMYVLTKNGKPAAVVVGVNHLEKLTGKTSEDLTSIVEKKADQTPVVEEIKSMETPASAPITETPMPEVAPEPVPASQPATTPEALNTPAGGSGAQTLTPTPDQSPASEPVPLNQPLNIPNDASPPPSPEEQSSNNDLFV